MHILKILSTGLSFIFLVTTASLAAQQTISPVGVPAKLGDHRTAVNAQLGKIDDNFDDLYSNKVFGTKTIFTQDAEPVTCLVGDLWIDTNGTSGQRLYTCEYANTWVAQAGGGAGDDLGDAAYSDVVALWTTCSGYLKSDGTCDTPSGSFSYPGAGVPQSTGSAWGMSLTVGTSANNLLQLNGSGQIPAVPGTLLTDTYTGTLLSGQTTLHGAVQTLATELDNAVDLTEGSNIDITAGAISVTTDFGGATSFEIPNGTGPTVDATGEVAVDTTSDQFVFYGGAKRVISYKGWEPFVIKSPVDADDFLIGPFPVAITITNIKLVAQGGGSIVITPQICAADTTTCSSLEAITADGGVDTDDGSLTYSAVVAGGFVKILSAAPTGTVNFLSGSIYYTITAD